MTKKTISGVGSPASQELELYAGPRNLGRILRDLHRSGRDQLKEEIARYGISIGAWYYLWALFEEDGLPQSELARRVRNVGPTAVTALNAMERNGLVRRVRSNTDRRVVNVFLTALAHELRPALEHEATRVNMRSLSRLTPDEVRTLCHLLDKVRSGLEERDDLS